MLIPIQFFLSFLILINICLTNVATAVVFFETDFESGIPAASVPSPIWWLQPTFPNFVGTGNHFEISTTSSHSNNSSLRFTYEARNNICNTCGTRSYTHKVGLDGVNYFLSDTDTDLTSTVYITSKGTNNGTGPAAEPGRLIYNTDGGFAEWIISSIANDGGTNNRLNVELRKPGINGEPAVFNGGDNVVIARQCNVDGTIGGGSSPDRRSDCNVAIAWFANIGSNDQDPGDSLFRRVYLKQEVNSPNVRQKLGYVRPDRGGDYQGEVVFFGHSTNGVMIPQVAGLTKYGAPIANYNPGNGLPANLEIERSKWYYVEIEYKAATYNGLSYNNDGEYRLWFSESGSEPVQSNPTLEVTGISLPPIVGGGGTHASFWGNVQHWTHARGSWYIDDFIISDSFNGPVILDGANTAPPKHPIIQN